MWHESPVPGQYSQGWGRVGKPAVIPMVENMKGETVRSWKLMQKCLDLDLKGSRKMALMVLCSHYPNIFPGEARIAKEAGIGLTAAKAATKYLEKEGWITRQRRHSKSTVYTVDVERIMATPRRELRIPAVEGGYLSLARKLTVPPSRLNQPESDHLSHHQRQPESDYLSHHRQPESDRSTAGTRLLTDKITYKS
jgi:hypothetical protein